MGKFLGSLTFQSEYFSEEVLKEKKGKMILPKQLKVELTHKEFKTPIGDGIPFGVVYLEITLFDLDSGEIDIRQAYNVVEASHMFRALAKEYGYSDEFVQKANAIVTDGIPKIKKVLYYLKKNGVYDGLKDVEQMKVQE